MSGSGDRGQAFTLEGVVAAMMVLIALLFALEAVLVTPITTGAVDEGTQSRLGAEASDVLRITADRADEDLAHWARYWSPVNRTFAGAESPAVGYGVAGPPGEFGTMLATTFTDRGRNYNVILHYRTGDPTNATGTVRMVYQGEPSESAVARSYTVTLFDDMTLTGPHATGARLDEMDTNATDNEDGYFYAPDAFDGVVYNVIEVRIVVW